MEQKQLFLEGGTAIKPHICGKCNRIWESKDSAERCCTCSYCGGYSAWNDGSVTHSECQRKHFEMVEAATLEKAELVPDYDGPFLIGERVYMDAADLLDWFADDELPEFGFCAKYKAPVLYPESIIENASSEMHDDWEAEDEPLLIAAIAAWNKANEKNGTYYEDRKRKWSKADLLRAAS